MIKKYTLKLTRKIVVKRPTKKQVTNYVKENEK